MNNNFGRALGAFMRMHAMKIAGGLIGITVFVLFISLGFWKTLLLFFLTGVGVIIGSLFDTRGGRFANIMERFFDDDSDRGNGGSSGGIF